MNVVLYFQQSPFDAANGNPVDEEEEKKFLQVTETSFSQAVS